VLIPKLRNGLLLLLFCLLFLTGYTMFLPVALKATLKLFSLGLSIDLLYVLYIRAVTKRTKIKAGLLSVGVAVPALLGTINVYDERSLIVPYMVGLFTGTYLAMLFEEMKK